jgi:hypothetical protein
VHQKFVVLWHSSVLSFSMPPSTTEIQHHITKLANNKSPGESGIPAEALKALPPDGIEYVRTLLQDFWEGRRIYEEWQTALLRVLYKKATKKNPQIIKV